MPEGTGPPSPVVKTGAERTSRKRYLPLVFTILALASVCASLVVPWYTHTLHDRPDYAGNDFTSYWDYNLFGTNYYNGADDATSFTAWSRNNYSASGALLYTHMLYLVIFGISLSVASVGACLAALRWSRREIAAALALALAAWCLFIPVFFMTNLAGGSDGKNISNFWNEEKIEDDDAAPVNGTLYTTRTWNPALGWYLALLSGVFGILAFVALVVPRPRPGFSRWRLPIGASVAAIVILMGSAAALYPGPPPPGSGEMLNIGLRAEALPGGDWLIDITSGSRDANEVYIQVIDPATGRANLLAKVPSGTASNPDFTWTDRSGNKKLDAGDSILLKGTVNGQPNLKIQDGFKVQFSRSSNIIGTVKELPPH